MSGADTARSGGTEPLDFFNGLADAAFVNSIHKKDVRRGACQEGGDRETINAIQENIYMQYFIGYSSFSNEAPFDASLFVDIRKRLEVTQVMR